MQLTDKDGNIFGTGGLEITTSSGKPKVPVINTDITIGTTAVIGGVSGRVLYNNAGVVGELDLSSIYVPTSRTLTINGVTQDLSANRTFTISTGITIGSTAIASGVVGRVLFEGAGNVVQESASIFWDIAGSKLNLGSLGVQGELVINRASTGGTVGGVKAEASGAGVHIGGAGYLDSIILTNGSGVRINTWTGSGSGSAERLRVTASTGNVLINTTTDAGFRFDVAGTGRFSNTLTIQTTATGGSPSNSILISTNDAGNGGRISWGDSNTSILRFSNSLYFREYTGNFVFENTNANAIYFSIRPWGTTLSAGPFTTNSSITAASAIARGAYFNNTLVAAANNDVLVGLDIAPTFTNGAFTGVSNWAMRLYNSIRFETPSDLSQGIFWKPANDGTTLRIYGSTFSAGIGFLQLNVQSGSDGLSVNGGARTLSINAAQSSISLNLNNILFNTHGTGEAARIVVSTKNFLIGTTTDAGYRLDVNGTARVSGAITCGEVNLSGSQLFTNKTTAPNSYLFSASNITILNGLFIRLTGGPVCVNESGANATASSVLDVSSTTKGFLPPRMTTTQKNAIATPAAGLVVYDTTLNKLCVYTTAWETVTSL